MFWTGMLVGIFVGSSLGVLLMALLVASRNDQYIPMRGDVNDGK